MKKLLCMVLIMVLLLSMLLLPVNAVEIDESDIGIETDLANTGTASHTQAEAVQWVNGKIGSTLGSGQCVALIEAYCSYLGLSVSGGNGNACDYTGARTISDSTRINNYNGFVPQPGDICVWGSYAYLHSGYQTSYYGHIGVVLSADASNMTTVECNLDYPYDGGPCKKVTQYRPTKNVTCFIRPNFKSSGPKPSNVWVNYKYSAIPAGASNRFTFGATNATSFNIHIDKDGALWEFKQGVTSDIPYTFNDEGNYTVWATAINSSGSVDSYKMEFTIFVPITLGNSFTAEITNPRSGVNLSTNQDGNVFVEKKTNSDYQKWTFERQKDNTYQITNVGANKCLDVYYGDTNPKTNIQVYPDNDRTSQRFYLRQCYYGYSIVPIVNTGLALDIYYDQSGYTGVNDYTNVQDYTYHKEWNQAFTIDPIDINPTVTQEYNGHTYEYYEMGVPWEQAVRICEKKGGHLVTISNQQENNIVSGMIPSHTWLGARTMGKGSSWFWINCENVSYTNWTPYQPDCYNNTEFFMMMYKDSGQWNDFPSTTSLCFVCEYDNGDVNAEKYTPNKILEKNGVKYGIFDYAVDWQSAESICEAMGGHLVKIDSAEKNQTFIEIMNEGGKDEYWFDATDRFSEGFWTDHDGNLLTYTNWQDAEPNNDFNIELYAAMLKSNKQWADFKGYNPVYRNIGFICEYDPVIPTEPPTAPPTEPPVNDYLGDADGDGLISAIDVTQITRAVAHISTGIDDDVLMNADVDGNGKLEIIDATYIQRYLAKMETPYQIGKVKG